jgi:hypothetical protein
MLFQYFPIDFEIFPFASIIIRFIFVLTFYLICIDIVRASYVKFIFAYFLIIFLSAKIALSIYIYIYIYIQGVPGGMCQTSGECSLC